MKTYENTTRLQHVQIVCTEKNEDGVERITYRVIKGNESNNKKEFVCTADRFFRNYVPLK